MNILVVKIGTNALLNEKGDIDTGVFSQLSEEISLLKKSGKKIVLVSSGSIGAAQRLYNTRNLKGAKPLERKQIQSSIGQPCLMQYYQSSFEKYDIPVAQCLVTRSDFAIRHRQVDMKRILELMLEGGILPIVNENDFLTPEELDFSDNDQLATFLAGMLGAQKLILLSNIDGLFDRNPKEKGAKKISSVSRITPEIESYVCTEKSNQGLGGMASKIQAAKILSALGIEMILGNSRQKGILLETEKWGTQFLAEENREKAGIKVWLLAGAYEKGALIVDNPLKQRLQKGSLKISLLGVGITEVQGNFEEGDVLGIFGTEGKRIGKGIARMNSQDMKENCGKKGSIFIHADCFVRM